MRTRSFLTWLLSASCSLAASANWAAGDRGSGQVTGPADVADVINRLRTDGIVLTYDPQDRTLHAGNDDVPSVTISKNR